MRSQIGLMPYRCYYSAGFLYFPVDTNKKLSGFSWFWKYVDGLITCG